MIVATSKCSLRTDGHERRRSSKEREGDQNKAKGFSHASTSSEDERSLAPGGEPRSDRALTFA